MEGEPLKGWEGVKTIRVKSGLHYHQRPIPTNWDLNIYRGCAHGCHYCFAKYSHSYIDSTRFFGDIFAKINVAECLDRELSRRSWRKHRINIGGVTDSYQPVEEELKIMPGVLEVLIKHKNPVVLSTKSLLILRDFDLIAQLASVTSVHIGTSINTLDENVRKKLEPNVPCAAERLKVLKQFKQVKCTTGLLLMPVIPFLTDSVQNLDNIFLSAKENQVDSIAAWPLNLRGQTKPDFFQCIRKNFPELSEPLSNLYPKSELNVEYHRQISHKIKALRKKYGISDIRIPAETLEKNVQPVQLKLF